MSLKELNFLDVVEKYIEVPKLIILKIDIQRRGIHYTEKALSVFNKELYQVRGVELFGARDSKLTPLPESIVLGTVPQYWLILHLLNLIHIL